jgi:large subunit ribosomal protein L28
VSPYLRQDEFVGHGTATNAVAVAEGNFPAPGQLDARCAERLEDAARGPQGAAYLVSRLRMVEGFMARKCVVTGKGVQVGHNVSHSNIKTKRRFLPNLQRTSVLSDTLGPIRLRVTAAAIRTIEHKGGIDSFLRTTPDRKLSPEIRRLKRRVAAAAARKGE